MKTLLLATLVTTLLTSQVRAADPELSTDTKRLLAYGTLAVMTGACKINLSADQAGRLDVGLKKASSAQKELTQEQFTEAMKVVGAQVGQNRDQICPSLTSDFIDASLEEAGSGD